MAFAAKHIFTFADALRLFGFAVRAAAHFYCCAFLASASPFFYHWHFFPTAGFPPSDHHHLFVVHSVFSGIQRNATSSLLPTSLNINYIRNSPICMCCTSAAAHLSRDSIGFCCLCCASSFVSAIVVSSSSTSICLLLQSFLRRPTSAKRLPAACLLHSTHPRTPSATLSNPLTETTN